MPRGTDASGMCMRMIFAWSPLSLYIGGWQATGCCLLGAAQGCRGGGSYGGVVKSIIYVYRDVTMLDGDPSAGGGIEVIVCEKK